MIFSETVGIAEWNITTWTIKPSVTTFLLAPDCMTADETAFSNMLPWNKSDEMKTNETWWGIDQGSSR